MDRLPNPNWIHNQTVNEFLNNENILSNMWKIYLFGDKLLNSRRGGEECSKNIRQTRCDPDVAKELVNLWENNV